MITTYEELIQYVRKLEKALDVTENENGVTTTEIGGHLNVDGNILDLSKIVDSEGNARFVEGEGTLTEQDGVTYTYNKWSLSGTHLMLVVAGTIAEATTTTSTTIVTFTDIPEWIMNKIYPSSYDTWVEYKKLILLNTDITQRTTDVILNKLSDTSLAIMYTTNQTFEKELNFRYQFDLLIDTD